MNKKKRRLVLLLASLVALAAILFLAHRLRLHSLMLKSRLTLVEHQVDGFSVRTLMLKEDDGRQRGLASTYWKAGAGSSATLSPEDINKILKANAETAVWVQEANDNLYRRWRRSDGKAGATYRKLDNRLCVFSDDFAAWRTRPGFTKQDAELFQEVME